MRVAFFVDRRAPAPLHRQIYDQWRAGILSGRFRRGERVPSSRESAAALGVARASVVTAYEQLIAEGYFEALVGSGTFVCRQLPEESLQATRPSARHAVTAATVTVSRHAQRLAAMVPRPAVESGVIDLSNRAPDVDQFPFRVWRRLATRHLRSAATGFRRPAEPAGVPRLREGIAAYLARSRAVRCSVDQVLVVNGSQQALDLCARLLVNAGHVVAVEDPGYPGARQAFAAYGARVRGIPVRADGLVAADLPAGTRVVFVTPSHQFPSGVSMSLTQRLALIEWSRTHDAVIVEDDYDSEYRYSGAPLPALQGLAHDAAIVYLGTFSNALFPGLRIGYVVVPTPLIDVFTRAKWAADTGTSLLDQLVLADFIREGHLDSHIRRMRRLYGRRRTALVEALDRAFGDAIEVRGDAAGMHLVARLPRTPDVSRLAAHKVRVRTTADHYLGSAPRGEVLFGFSAIGERALKEGVKRLAAAMTAGSLRDTRPTPNRERP
jgi:GntR family transcriptional regulator / MocR family aminotransferase